MDALRPDDPPRIGPFTPLARIGSGGMGRVYLARSRGGRPVAVKVIRGEYAEDPRFRTRFRREVEAARTVSGLYTASVLDAGPDDENPWLATAYIPGPSLQQLIHDQGPLPERSARILAAGIAEALGAIHAAGLIHRDLKPSNVICGPDGPRVIDFGISHAIDAAGTALTATGLVVGSPRYASPEQCRADAEVVPASDVFALGGVLVYAVTGVPPFGDGPDHVQLYLVVHEQPDLAAIPAALRPVVAACLDKDPANRPSIDRLLDELLPPDQAVGGADWLPAAAGGLLSSYAVASLTGATETPTHHRPDQDPVDTAAGRRPDPELAGAAVTGHQPGGTAHLRGDQHTAPLSGRPVAEPPAVGTQTPHLGLSQQQYASTPARSEAPAPSNPTRRKLLTGVVGVAAMAASGGAAWWAATSKDKKAAAQATLPGPPTTAPTSAPSQTPVTTPPSTPGTDPSTPADTATSPGSPGAAWTKPVNLSFGRGAVVRGGRLVGIHQNSGTSSAPLTLIALNATDGSPAWQQALPPADQALTLPIAADDTAVYTFSAGTVSAWRLTDGKKSWSLPTGLPLPVAGGVDGGQYRDSFILGLLGGVLFVGVAMPETNDSVCLVGLDVAAKKVLWSRKGSDFLQGLPTSPAVTNPLVVITVPDTGSLAYATISDATSARVLKALSPTTGKDVWATSFSKRTTNAAKSAYPTVTATSDAVYLTDMHSGYLHAYDTAGKWKWTYPHSQSSDAASVPLTSRFSGPVAVADGVVYAADATAVHAFDAGSGVPKAGWDKAAAFSAGLRTPPVAVGGRIWAEADTPTAGPGPLTLFALDAATGRAATQIGVPLAPASTDPDSLVAGPDTLYLVSVSGAVLAFR